MMASTVTSPSFIPHQSSPLARTTSPFKDPRTPPPSTPPHTAKLWDEFEKRAIENAKRRGATFIEKPQSQRLSSGTVYDIIRSYDPHASPSIGTSPSASPQFDFGFQVDARHKSRSDSAHSTTVAICKTCKQSIASTSGICEACKKTIVLPSVSGESTPPLTPACRNFASTDLPKLHKESTSGQLGPISSPPKPKSQCPSTSVQPIEPPIRLSSLRPPPGHDESKTSTPQSTRSRKTSLTDPNEPFLRLQIARKPVPRTHPSSPTTPPSTSHILSHRPTTRGTRPSSLANITTPQQYAYTPYTRHVSATPSELSTLYPYVSNPTTSPPSVGRGSYSLQNTTSAWDDWDSDEEEERVGLVGYWRGRKWRGSRGSLGGTSASGIRRDSNSAGKEDDSADLREANGKMEGRSGSWRKKRGVFVRVVSCGCAGNE